MTRCAAAFMSIEVANESGVEVDETRLVALSRFVLDQLRIHPLAELSLLLVDARRCRSCTCSGWTRRGRPTSSPFRWTSCVRARKTRPSSRASWVTSCSAPSVAATQAVTAGHSTGAELEMLTTHGILHLLGYDHAEPEEREEMFRLQGELLAAWAQAKGWSAS